jgi:hypothetical protein
MSALATEPLELAAPGEGSTRARRDRLQLVSPPRGRLTGGSLPGFLLDGWNRALAATERALDAATSMKVYAPDELRLCRHRLGEERRWLLRQGGMR